MLLDDDRPGVVLLEPLPAGQTQPLAQSRGRPAGFRACGPGRAASPGSKSSPVAPSATVNGRPPSRLATTGRPAAIASTAVRPSASWATVGMTSTSAARTWRGKLVLRLPADISA